MRRFLPGLASMESSFVAYKDRDVLSMEEVDVAMDEAHGLAQSIHSDLAEVDRMDDVAASLSNLADAATGITSATPRECKMIEITGDVAVAGTNIPPEDFIPGMESFIGKTISVEGFREKAKALWEAIKKILKKIWDSIKGFFKATMGTIPSLTKSIHELREKHSVLKKKALKEAATTSIGLKSHTSSLSVDRKPVKNSGELIDAIKALHKNADYVYKGNTRVLLTNGEVVKHAIVMFDPTDPSKSRLSLRGQFKDPSRAIDHHELKESGSEEVGDWKITHLEPFLGNANLAFKANLKHDVEDSSSPLQLTTLASASLFMEESKGKSEGGDAIFEIPTLDKIWDLLEDLEALALTIEMFDKDDYSKLVKLSEEIASASEQASKKDGVEDLTVIAEFRGIIGLGVAYAHWVESPYIKFTRHIAVTMRAVIAVLGNCVAQYE